MPQILYVPEKLVKIDSLNKYNYIKWLACKIAQTNSKEYPIEYFYALGWSGILSSAQRLNASHNLYNQIKELIIKLKLQTLEYKINIITHSHGGNIALNLAKICNENNFEIEKLILLACPVIEETKNLINCSIFKNIYSIYSNIDMFQVLSLQNWPNFQKKPVFSQRKFELNNNLKQIEMRMNGTPVWHTSFIFAQFPTLLPFIVSKIDESPAGDYILDLYHKFEKVKKIDIHSISNHLILPN